jgi:hypothetical protein
MFWEEDLGVDKNNLQYLTISVNQERGSNNKKFKMSQVLDNIIRNRYFDNHLSLRKVMVMGF